MLLLEARIAAYEGLIFSTAARYAPYLDDDLDDVAQVLRIKVWKALEAFDPSRSRLGEKSHVFGCVRNQVKDLLKGQDSRNRLRQGAQAFVADIPPLRLDRLTCVGADVVYAHVEDDELRLPSTLTERERQVTVLLLLDFGPTEIAKLIGVTRYKVRDTQKAIQTKMADWRPTTQSVEADEMEAVAA